MSAKVRERGELVSRRKLEPQEGQLISSRTEIFTTSMGLWQCGQRMCIACLRRLLLALMGTTLSRQPPSGHTEESPAIICVLDWMSSNDHSAKYRRVAQKGSFSSGSSPPSPNAS